MHSPRLQSAASTTQAAAAKSRASAPTAAAAKDEGTTSTGGDDIWQQFGGASGAAKGVKPALGRQGSSLCKPYSGGVEPSFYNKYKSKTEAQLRELSSDLANEMRGLRNTLRACEDTVRHKERDKQSKQAELREASAGSALDWILLKNEANFPEAWDNATEQARDAVQDAAGRVTEQEARLVAVQEMLDRGGAEAEDGMTQLFIHFIPPPLRAQGKSHLPWIIHTCDGSGCYEARHVSIHSVAAFSTFEGSPPEQAEGKACRCQIANHHLRGVGKVRWEGPDAIVENDATGKKSGAMINGHAYREQALRQAASLTQARDEIKRLRAVRVEMASQQKQELMELRSAMGIMEDNYRNLSINHELLKVKHQTQNQEWQKLFAETLA